MFICLEKIYNIKKVCVAQWRDADLRGPSLFFFFFLPVFLLHIAFIWYAHSMKHYNFPIVIEHDKDGYYAFCPELQGCYSQGNTYEEALENIKDAIKLHVEDRKRNKETLPDIKSISLATVEIAV